MNTTLILALILFALTAAVSALALRTDPGPTRGHLTTAALALAVAATLTFAAACVVMVSTKTVGVVVTFGKPVATLPNGLHTRWPWHTVTEFDAAIQTTTHAGADTHDPTPCTPVRLAGQSTACVDHTVRWRIRPGAATDLYRDYKDFANVRESLVTRKLTSAVATTFAPLDPLANLDNNKPATLNLPALADEVSTRLRAAIGTQIEVLDITIPMVHFDTNTETRISTYQSALADTRIAKQREETALADAKANAALAASVNAAPNVLVSKCLDILTDARAANYQLPAGFSCWPHPPLPVAVTR